MASLFDPSAFIAAEKRETLATIADGCAACDTVSAAPEQQKSAVLGDTTFKQSQLSQESQPLGAEIPLWGSGPAKLAALPRPLRMKETEWKRLVRLTKWVAEDWAESAAACGWDLMEVFGCNPDPFAGRVDRDGLVTSLFRMKSPAQVTAVHPDHIEITANGKDVMRYRPFGRRGQVYLWEAYGMRGGP